MSEIIAGYLIIEYESLPKCKTDNRLPERLISASDCLCSIHPGNWGISWASNKEEIEKIKKKAGLSDEDLAQIQSEVDELLDKGEYGFPNVFLSLEVAKDFRARNLKSIECEIVRISLPEKYFVEAIQGLKSEPNLMENGIFLKLNQRQPDLNDGHFLGYEVLCWDVSSFHSFICNGLEKDYEEKLHLKLNQNGFFNDLDSAMKAVEYTRRDDVGAEPGFWAPFKMVKENAA